ncbi:MAG: hypothetical protein G8345_15175 [Magnetococcales bacterium]|nr:hypothetical protein [Magnetococcales bacterium]NGZ28221.1 hypothetical protein [Magnetococcales bacterium]
MDVMPATNRQSSKPFFRRAERADVLLRIEFSFEGVPILHGTTDNGSHGGLFAHCTSLPCQGMIGRVGTCRVFIGMDYLEFPCQVKRVLGDGLGIHLMEGYDEEFNMVMDHLLNAEVPEGGLDFEDAAVIAHGPTLNEVRAVH